MNGEGPVRNGLKQQLTLKQAKIMMAMESVLIDIVNFIKKNGEWIDRTGNLRNSISYETPKVQEELGLIRGVVYAGMDYAIYVEYRPGKWVLSGAKEEFRPILLRLIHERAKSYGL